jgi:hypothetical protein
MIVPLADAQAAQEGGPEGDVQVVEVDETVPEAQALAAMTVHDVMIVQTTVEGIILTVQIVRISEAVIVNAAPAQALVGIDKKVSTDQSRHFVQGDNVQVGSDLTVGDVPISRAVTTGVRAGRGSEIRTKVGVITIFLMIDHLTRAAIVIATTVRISRRFSQDQVNDAAHQLHTKATKKRMKPLQLTLI